MQRLQAFQYTLKPDASQLALLAQFAGARRFVFNKALALQKARHAAGEKHLSYADLCNKLVEWKQEEGLEWMAQMPSQVLQQSLKDLDKAYKSFFDDVAKGYRIAPDNRKALRKLRQEGIRQLAHLPTFKKKFKRERFRYPQGFELDQERSRIKLPKLGWVKYINSREVLGKIANVTISLHAGKWLVSIQTEREVPQPVPMGSSAIGVDVGVVNFAAFSDGGFLAPLNSFRRHEKRLARESRKLSRQKKNSNNWKKQKNRIARLHAHIANGRKDFLHKATTQLCKNHAVIVIEDLKVRNMTKSARGTVEEPGRRVRQKSGLNKAILDQGWAEFRRQLTYKAEWFGVQLVVVAPHYTSQTCPACGHVSAENCKTQAKFACVACGHSEHADTVGAKNILRKGLESLAL